MVNLLSQYLIWHFYEVTEDILKAWKNFLKFNLNYFSTPLLIRTLFSHWRRYKMSYGKGFDIGRYFEVSVFNLFSRFIGAVLRIFLILIGLLFEILIIFIGLIIFLGWLILPLLLILGLLWAFKLLI